MKKGKPQKVNQKLQYQALTKRLNKYMLFITRIYEDVCKEAANIVLKTGYDGEGVFSFARYPFIKNAVDKLLDTYASEMSYTIISLTSKEWKKSNVIQDMMVNQVLRSYTVSKGDKRKQKYYLSNNDALKEFQKRKINGMNLSQRIWNQRKDLKDSLELTISIAVEKGTSAVKLSKKISKYLSNYQDIKKDYKEKYGKAVDIKNCEYNSMRLARSEINMAYRKAEQERWRQLDFILGYEIHTSSVHGHEHSDICDELQGQYPGWFNWSGWHPNCMCYAVPIVMTNKEYLNFDYTRKIQDVPDNYKEWLMDNRERIYDSLSRGTAPYFIVENEKYNQEILGF